MTELFNLFHRFMLQKLYALVDQTASPDNADALQNQEVLMPGHLIAVYLKVTVCFYPQVLYIYTRQ